MKKELRPYQIQAIESIDKTLEKGIDSMMLVMATGTGKTFTAVKAIDKYKRVLWLTHSEELIEQSALALIGEKLSKKHVDRVKSQGGLINFLGNTVGGLLSDKADDRIVKTIGVIKQERMDVHAKIVVASIQTICRRLGKIDPNMFDCIVVDECHLAMAKTWNNTIDHFNVDLLLGLTATPHRLDGMGLGNLFEEIAFEYSIEKGVHDGYLTQIDAIRIRTDVNLDSVKTVAGELSKKDLTQTVNNPARNNLIVDSYEKYASGRQGIIFCVDVQHAMDVAATFVDRGHDTTTFVVGDKNLCPNRKEIIGQFKKGNIGNLVNCMILTTGFDHPNVGWIGMAAPTKSLTKYLQCIGRGTRLKDDSFEVLFGQNVVVLDFVDVTSRHRIVNTWELDKAKPFEERIFITQEKREGFIQQREAKIDRVTTKDQRVNLIKLPVWVMSKSVKMKEPATDKQMSFISRLGYATTENFYSKADAAMIISSAPATEKQIWALKQKGYDTRQGVTIGEASLAFEELERAATKKAEEIMLKRGSKF